MNAHDTQSTGTAHQCGVHACADCEAKRLAADIEANHSKAEKALAAQVRAALSVPDPFYQFQSAYDPT